MLQTGTAQKATLCKDWVSKKETFALGKLS